MYLSLIYSLLFPVQSNFFSEGCFIQKETVSLQQPFIKLEVEDTRVDKFPEFASECYTKFPHFWRSTGLCPPEPFKNASAFLRSKTEIANLALIGSVPFQGIAQVRVHWLLNLVKGRLVNKSEPQYNFKDLDQFLDILHKYRLKPGFEVMGNPSGIFNDLENRTQLEWWKDLVRLVAERYIGKYGLKWVTTWNWESWNEPDHHDFDNLNFTSQGFLNYIEATQNGLKEANRHLKFGGPGGSCRDRNFSMFCWKILELANNASVKLDFISFHKKGNVDSMIQEELLTIAKIRKIFPNLSTIPIYNDEADFEKGWWKSGEWKADNRYAALVVRSVTKHAYLRLQYPHAKYNLMSFDNAFLNNAPLNFFDQRTLITRFNPTLESNVQLVRKPSYLVTGLLALLGNYMVPAQAPVLDQRLTVLVTFRTLPKSPVFYHSNLARKRTNCLIGNTANTKSCGAYSTIKNRTILIDFNTKKICSGDVSPETLKEIQELTVLMSFSNDTEKSPIFTNVSIKILLPYHLINVPLYLLEYSLDEGHSGPYEAWKNIGSPRVPTHQQLLHIRRFERIPSTGVDVVKMAGRRELHREFHLSLPAVKLLHICSMTDVRPPKVADVQCLGLTEFAVLITWSDKFIETRCVHRYDLYYSKHFPEEALRRINKIKLANNAIYSSSNETVDGWYSVRAILYDGSKGPRTKPVFHHYN